MIPFGTVLPNQSDSTQKASSTTHLLASLWIVSLSRDQGSLKLNSPGRLVSDANHHFPSVVGLKTAKRLADKPSASLQPTSADILPCMCGPEDMICAQTSTWKDERRELERCNTPQSHSWARVAAASVSLLGMSTFWLVGLAQWGMNGLNAGACFKTEILIMYHTT